MNKVQSQFEDILSLVVLRLFAKYKKNMISKDDFTMVAAFGAGQAIGIITVKSRRIHLEEMMDEELRKACELISTKGCGLCKGRGIKEKRGARYIVCKCANMIKYRGDTVLPLGEQYSNQYFTTNLSKTELGSKSIVENIAAAVMLFLIPKE